MKIIEPCARTTGTQKLAPLSGKDKFLIQVFDLYGNLMIETKQKSININNLKNGLYIIRANINEEILTHKTIKQ